MISVIICSVNGTKFVAIKEHYQKFMGDEPHEVIGIHDAKSMCEGYNRGFAQSKGDIVIFSHDDVEMLAPDFVPRLKRHMANFDVVGLAGTDQLIGASWEAAGPPHIFGQVAHLEKRGLVVCLFGVPRRAVDGIHAMDGLFLSFRRDAIEKLGGWDEKTFTGWHCYDVDMVYRAHLAGMKVAVACDLPLLHYSIGDFGDAWQQSARLFLMKYAGKMKFVPQRWHQFGAAQVGSREEAVALMTPRYWRECD